MITFMILSIDSVQKAMKIFLLTEKFSYDTILATDSKNASMHYFVPYYPFGNHGGVIWK